MAVQPTPPRRDGSAIAFCDLTKRYGSFAAVKGVSLSIAAGEVHALVGANGAGKSTLLGMLSGRTAPSEGTIHVFGAPLAPGNPRASKAEGIGIVYQELTVLPALNAVANVFLGNETIHAGLLDERVMRARYLARCRDFGLDIAPETLGRDLPVSSQQMLEIMRAVELDARILILDEPTAALSYREREFLLDLIGRLKARGVTIMLVTHNLDEVLGVSDRITVLRDGRVVETRPAAAWSKRSLVETMTGNVPVSVTHARIPKAGGPVHFRAAGITLPGAIEDITVEVRAGEVLGIAGLVGAGRSSFLRSVAGVEPHATGTVTLNGETRPLPSSPRAALDLGIALLPEDRKTQGLVLGLTIGDNVTLPVLDKVARRGLVSRARQTEIARRMLSQFTLSRPIGDYPVGALSGGNQQKVVFSKLLLVEPEVLLIDEPTRGIDVAAKAEVLQAMRRYAEEKQRAVIMTSTEIEEVIEVADRIVVMANGRVVGELDNSRQQVVPGDVLKLAFGVGEDDHDNGGQGLAVEI